MVARGSVWWGLRGGPGPSCPYRGLTRSAAGLGPPQHRPVNGVHRWPHFEHSALRGADQGGQQMLGASRNCSGLLGAARGCSELLGAARSCSE